MKNLLKENQRVLVHSFGDGKVGYGTIRGLAFDYITQIYIVALDQPDPWNHRYTSIAVPVGCLDVVD